MYFKKFYFTTSVHRPFYVHLSLACVGIRSSSVYCNDTLMAQSINDGYPFNFVRTFLCTVHLMFRGGGVGVFFSKNISLL